ncbi:MAG: RNA polymerase sigma factor [Dysgonomonas sp.]
MKIKSIQKQKKSVESQVVSISFEKRNELFEIYVKPYMNFIYWLVIKYTNHRFYIDEFYNEVLLIFYKHIHTYDPNRNIQTWLHVIISRAVGRLNRSYSNTLFEYDLSQIADDYYYYDVETSRKSDYLTNYRLLFSDDILWALNKLSSVQRETLLLYLSGYSNSEIAHISFKLGTLDNKNTETVKSRIHLAKVRMRRLIDKNGYKRTY